MKTIFLLRKPLEGNLVKNTLTHGCGGLNIDAARISFRDLERLGRFPANFLLADIEAARGLDNQSGFLQGRGNKSSTTGGGGYNDFGAIPCNWGEGDEGGASRFFKCLEEDK